MIEMENKKDLVRFEYEGKTYAMTREEIEAAYRYQEQQYRKCDAEVAVDWFVFGTDGESLSGEEYAQAVAEFEKNNGVTYEELMAEVPSIVGIFFQKSDANEPENQTWSIAVEEVVRRLKLKKNTGDTANR